MQASTVPALRCTSGLARLTEHRDKGELLYPTGVLLCFVQKLENWFTECFSRNKLQTDSILDILAIVKSRFYHEIGCQEHAAALTAKVIGFYLTTRLHCLMKHAGLTRDPRVALWDFP